MNLGAHYNAMYKDQKIISDTPSCFGWPTNRFKFAICNAKPGRVVCDVGCGGGEILYSLQDKYEKFIGFEISDGRIRDAKKRCELLDCEFINDRFDKAISLEENTVDTVICLDVLDHMIDVREAISNFYKILKVDGQLILNIPNFARIDKRLKLLRGIFPSTSTNNEGVEKLGNSNLFDGGKLHYFTFNSIIQLLQEAGFKKIEKYGIGKYKKVHNLYPELLSGSISLICTK